MEELEARLDSLGRDLQDLRGARREAVALEQPPALPTDEVFVEHYRDIVVDIVDRERMQREIARKTDVVCAIIMDRAEQDPEVERNASALLDLGRRYMERQKDIIVTFTPHGTWPKPSDTVYAEWESSWVDLRAWLNAELSQTLDPESAALLSDSITRNSYVKEW